MRTIRMGSFETNSSSTHAIVVPKQVDKDNYSVYDSLDHDYGFGRQESRLVNAWDEKLAYVYIILKENVVWSQQNGWRPEHITTEEEVVAFKKRITAIWENVVQLCDHYDNSPTPTDVFNYIDESREDGNLTGDDSFVVLTSRWGNYVDHANGLDDTDFLDRIKNDDEFVQKLIFNTESYITIGGDEYRGYNLKQIGFEYDYNTNEEWARKVQEYEKDNDVYLKGN